MAIRVTPAGRTGEEPADVKPIHDDRNRIGLRLLFFATLRDSVQETGWDDTERISTGLDAVAGC
jgi:hypothetical protein